MTLPQPIADREVSAYAQHENAVDLEDFTIQLIPMNRLSELHGDWLWLEKQHLGSPYHAYEWCKSWCDHIADKEHATPLFLAGYHRDSIHFLLPLAVQTRHLVKSVKWLGEDIFNQNTGYWSEQILNLKDIERLRPTLVDALKEYGVDLIRLGNMPRTIGKHRNPLVREHDVTSTNAIYPFELQKPAEEFVKTKRSKAARKKHRGKLTKLQQSGTVEFITETTSEGTLAAINAMIGQRETRQAETGIPTAFSSLNYQSFIRDAFANLSRGTSPTKPIIYSLRLDGEIISTCLSLKAADRLYCYSTSIINGELMRHSPGELLMQHVIEDMCEEGIAIFDFGLGKERFKLSWAEPESLQDWIEPLTLKGKIAAELESLKLIAKRKLRNNQQFWKFYRYIRGSFARLMS
ncbi:GNAT family N-acetyltransferase [Pseudovibrio sp. Tun.PSC04-5.I4]|uniref:GNAT family N-acetyltransferase n=1 Tax=Pseudovibrio sp. Tun.PSC04-5.I4 TaxID=1798213 RepID=UPI000884EC7D|nr:GNAT family N-acetyltransferase [Pseudovibrio sp. Tun.PSC04-5.I4]SDR12377.1 Acetyltransferase involved in cellulose biosynthesis, CelD/BcsL family [Pseudovibrio sp. Tun.PSC04-5.I4]